MNKYDEWREDVEMFNRGCHAQAVLELWDEFQPEMPLLACDKLMSLLNKVLYTHDFELALLEAKIARLEAKLNNESEVEL